MFIFAKLFIISVNDANRFESDISELLFKPQTPKISLHGRNIIQKLLVLILLYYNPPYFHVVENPLQLFLLKLILELRFRQPAIKSENLSKETRFVHHYAGI